MKKLLFKKYLYLFIRRLLLSGGMSLGMVAISLPALGAENIRFNYGVLGFSLSIDSLELYAKEGKINSELNFYTKRLDAKKVKQLRRVLSRKINIDPILLYRLTRSPMVIEIFESLGEVATTHRGHNGFHALRGSIVNVAIENQDRGMNLIDVMRRFPTEDIQVDLRKFLEVRDELTTLVEYREAIRELVIRQAQQEADATIANSFLPKKDLQVAGGISFTQETIEIDSRMADKSSGVRSREPFRVRLYLPQGLLKPAPVVILSHGFGSEPKFFDYLGEHLASYGIAAVSVEHLGSDSDYELEILEGAKKRAISAQEFIERPLDIQSVLDELEHRNRYDSILKGSLDLNKVGMVGHSLGGYTTLALAGAEINVERLRQQCPNKKINLNISLVMQCRAKELVPERQLADPRIDAAIAISPISSAILGKEGLTNISIPTAIVSGSEDIIAPVVQEQVYPFTWLSAKDKYLAMIIPGDHFSSSSLPRKKRCRREAKLPQSPKGTMALSRRVLGVSPQSAGLRPVRPSDFAPKGLRLRSSSRTLRVQVSEGNSDAEHRTTGTQSVRSDCIKKPADPTVIEEFIGKRLASGQSYIKAFVLAFVKAHVEQDTEYLSYLTADYAQEISNDELDFSIVRSLKLEALEQEFVEALPIILPTLAD